MAMRWCTGVDLSAGMGGRLAEAMVRANSGAPATIQVNCILTYPYSSKRKKGLEGLNWCPPAEIEGRRSSYVRSFMPLHVASFLVL